MYKQKTKAFTLVELIVAITILAILGTIAFISLQGYSSNSRDSVRISDISSMKISLELFNLESGKYPQPTNLVPITYSGAVVWNQGTFGDSVYKNLSKLDKIPLDPTTDKEYTYSVTSNKNEYQLGGIVEGDVVVMNIPLLTPPYQGGGLAQQTNAGETTATAYVTGNYNGLMTKSNSGTTCNVLSIPAIITNDTSVTDLQQVVINNNFVYRGYKNLPSSFKTSKFKYNGGFVFTPNNLIAYTDTGSCTELTSTTSSTARVNLLKGLQDAYSGTTVKNEGEIRNIVALNINTSLPSNEVINYAGNFVNNNLGGNVVVGGNLNSSSGGASQPTECGTGMTELMLSNGQTWSCMNLGATTVRDGSTAPTNCVGSGTNCNSGLTWIGDYYQWGRNDTGWTSGFSGAPYSFGWEVQNDTKWGGSISDTTTSDGVGTTAVGRQGPCPNGWHVPSIKDWQSACDNILGTTCSNGMAYNSLIATKLRLPFAGYRPWTSGLYYGQSTSAYYWSSSPFSTFAYALIFDTSGIAPVYGYARAPSFSVRCLKN